MKGAVFAGFLIGLVFASSASARFWVVGYSSPLEAPAADGEGGLSGTPYPPYPYDLITDPVLRDYDYGLRPVSDTSSLDSRTCVNGVHDGIKCLSDAVCTAGICSQSTHTCTISSKNCATNTDCANDQWFSKCVNLNLKKPWGVQKRVWKFWCEGWQGIVWGRFKGRTIELSLKRAEDILRYYGHNHPADGGEAKYTVGTFEQNPIVTGDDGYAYVLWDAPEAAGVVEVTMKCQNGPEYPDAEQKFYVGFGVRGLLSYPLEEHPNIQTYKFTGGGRAEHPYTITYGTVDMNKAIKTVAEKFYNYTGMPLPISDIGLPYGGMYEYDKHDWKPGAHTWHRMGTDVDINLHDPDSKDRPGERAARRKLLVMCRNSHLHYYAKEPASAAAVHVHFIYDTTVPDAVVP